VLDVFITTVVLVLVAVGVHYELLRAISDGLPRLPVPPRLHVAVAILGALVAHIVEILVFAAGIAALIAEGYGEIGGADGSVHDVVYFSIVTYTSLGYGDVVPLGPLRLLAGVETLTGLVLIAWTASFTFYQMQRFWRNA